MARVEIALNGRAYALACEDGQEQRLRDLAAYVDARLREIGGAAPNGSEAHLLALVTLTLADEIFDLRSELRAARGGRPPAPTPAAVPADTENVVAAVDSLAKRIEDIAARLERA